MSFVASYLGITVVPSISPLIRLTYFLTQTAHRSSIHLTNPRINSKLAVLIHALLSVSGRSQAPTGRLSLSWLLKANVSRAPWSCLAGAISMGNEGLTLFFGMHSRIVL